MTIRAPRAVFLLSILSVLGGIFPRGARGAGYEFEGVGARQVSRAGAAIADSDDWTSLYWNPGNMTRALHQSRGEFGIELFGGEAYGKDSNSLSAVPGAGPFSKDDLHSNFILGAIGAVLPLGEKGGIGLGFYTPLLQGAKFNDTSASSPPMIIDLEAAATILTWALSGSYAITPQFSAGAGLNLLYGRLTNDIVIDNFLIPTNTTSSDLDGDGFGLEGIFGLRYDPPGRFSLGAVVRTGSDLELKGEAQVNNTSAFLPDEKSNFTYELRQPPTWGVGSAFRPTKQWTLTLDFNRTLWHRFKSNAVYDSPGTLLANGPNSFHWKDSWKVRLGARLVATKKVEYLWGYSYDSPALDAASVDFATAIDVPMHRFSTGIARRWSDRLETVLGIIGGAGKRTEGNNVSRLSGYQIMIESRMGF